MGYYLNLGDKTSVPLASTKGWADVDEWSQSADESRYGELLQLIDNSLSQEIPTLLDQVRLAMTDASDPSVVETLTTLAKSLAAAPEGIASVSVTDGMGPDDGQPDDGWVVGDDPCDCPEGAECNCKH